MHGRRIRRFTSVASGEGRSEFLFTPVQDRVDVRVVVELELVDEYLVVRLVGDHARFRYGGQRFAGSGHDFGPRSTSILVLVARNDDRSGRTGARIFYVKVGC